MWRYAWAHKPLCDRFHRDTIRIGGAYLCRSCTALYAGLALGVVAGVVVGATIGFGPMTKSVAIPIAVAALSALVLPMSMPRWYAGHGRVRRDMLRGGLGLLLAATGWLLASPAWLPGIAVAIGLLALHRLYLPGHRRVIGAGCNGCPQLDQRGSHCDGYRQQAEAMTAMATEFESRLRDRLRASAVPAIAPTIGPATPTANCEPGRNDV